MGQKKVLIGILAAAIVFFAAVGFLALGAYTLLSKRRAVGPASVQIVWEDPIAQINVSEVSPATGLLRLAGMDEISAINSALRQGDLGSAYSLLAFSIGLSDEERIGSLLLIGKRYAAAGNVEKARLVYRQVNLIAVLSPVLSDFARADALLQSGEELAKIKQVNEALITLNQARNIGLYSVYLKSAHRKHILDRLIPAYYALGAGREAWEELEMAMKPGASGQVSPPEPLESVVGGFSQQGSVSPEVEIARSTREAAASNLAEYIRDRGGNVSETLLNELATALMVEDAQRQGVYETGLLGLEQLSDRIALLESRIRWLVVKYSVARRAQGISLSPAWESQLAGIQSELARTWQDLYALYGDRVVALPEASTIDRAWVELYRRELLMGRLGLYPSYPEEQLLAKLRDATQKVMAAGYDQSLRVDTVPGQDKPMFVLVDAPDYGKGLVP